MSESLYMERWVVWCVFAAGCVVGAFVHMTVGAL